MTLLITRELVSSRVKAVAGGLAPLARALRTELEPLLVSRELFIPAEKARLTRKGGRCPVHGVLLDFDPWNPRVHHCSLCQADYTDDEHYRWWIMNYQLWLAERSVHAAALGLLTGDHACSAFAETVLKAYADKYLTYENKDNVLGPTRLFFSTYLESIWLLQLSNALALLEVRGAQNGLGGMVRDRLIEPSARLISEYDEGQSNRQTWNNAALLAAGVILGDNQMVDRTIGGRTGLTSQLEGGLLADGTWYEGENYHLFAHRGLWYGVQCCTALGIPLPDEGIRRFAEGFATPLATALPDFTFPARRDSQYAVSLRQWRFAESCELGLSYRDDPRLASALLVLYGTDLVHGDTGRSRSTAEAERNAPASGLRRADLGWKSLLCAREHLAPAEAIVPASVHLSEQGFGVFRRRRGRVYVALDYGTPGGGHGHPDRLNAWLVVGNSRVLEDVGTGSYVDRSLFWYRSTLAHNAPLVDGKSQPYDNGRLLAWEERGAAGWIEAAFDIVPGRVRVIRRLIVLPDYMIDELEWDGADVITLDLPFHTDAELDLSLEWRPVTSELSPELGNGFEFLHDVEMVDGRGTLSFRAGEEGSSVRAWVHCNTKHDWYRAVAPGPPGQPERSFIFARARSRSGRIRSVWAWGKAVTTAQLSGEGCSVESRGDRHVHQSVDGRWSITMLAHGARSSIDLEGRVTAPAARSRTPEASIDQSPGHVLAPGRPFEMELGKRHYRRSEEPWESAGSPEATIRVAANRASVDVDIEVRKRDPYFAPIRSDNPLDNEEPDINSDGVQLYIYLPDSHAYASWIIVPEGNSGEVRIRPRESAGTPPRLEADCRVTESGYRVRCELERGPRGLGIDRRFMLNVVVNEMPRDRERRRGQLVATGGGDEWVYLRGDREDMRRMLGFEIVDG